MPSDPYIDRLAELIKHGNADDTWEIARLLGQTDPYTPRELPPDPPEPGKREGWVTRLLNLIKRPLHST